MLKKFVFFSKNLHVKDGHENIGNMLEFKEFVDQRNQCGKSLLLLLPRQYYYVIESIGCVWELMVQIDKSITLNS